MYAKHPGIAKKFEKETPKGKKLPMKKGKPKDRQMEAMKRMMGKMKKEEMDEGEMPMKGGGKM